MNELETTVAAPFKHGKKDRLTRMELVFYYVQDKRWMNQDQAKKLIDLATRRGILHKEEHENSYCHTAPLADVTIPLGFRPGDGIFAEDAADQDPVELLLSDISAATGIDTKELAVELQQISRQFDDLLLPQAAVILLAKKYRVATAAYKPALAAGLRAAR